MDIKDWIKAARQHAGWTQEKLGEAVGRTKANVGHWETGKHEPKLEQIAAIVTREYLHPAVEDDSYVITVDTAVLRLRPNRSKEALELNDRGLLSSEATLRETGFDPETDAMKEPEKKAWLLWKMAAGSWSPEMIAMSIPSRRSVAIAPSAPLRSASCHSVW